MYNFWVGIWIAALLILFYMKVLWSHDNKNSQPQYCPDIIPVNLWHNIPPPQIGRQNISRGLIQQTNLLPWTWDILEMFKCRLSKLCLWQRKTACTDDHRWKSLNLKMSKKFSAILILCSGGRSSCMTDHSTTKLIKNNKLDVQVSIRWRFQSFASAVIRWANSAPSFFVLR